MTQPQIIELPRQQEMETQLAIIGSSTVNRARALVVNDEVGFNDAAEFLRQLKSTEKSVKDYWSPIKTKAKAAHQEIVNKEKAMLMPISQAEMIVKQTMGMYQRRIEDERRCAEAEAQKRQQEERDRLLAEAIKAEEKGDDAEASTNVAMAELVEDMAPAVTAAPAAKAAGISMRKSWKAKVTDAAKVPVAANGIEIRPINMAALNNIARLTKGTAEIPGVEFFEDTTISARTY